MTSQAKTGRPIAGILFWVALVSGLGLVHSCTTDSGADVRTAGSSFFPLSTGNKWLLARDSSAFAGAGTDTILIDERATNGQKTFYHLQSSRPMFGSVTWVRRDGEGNLLWCTTPGAPEHMFLQLDGPLGRSWPTGMGSCMDSLSTRDDYAVVNTPYGRFDGAREIGDNGHCADAGWGIKLARGVGPVSFVEITIAGSRRWLLSDAQVHDDASQHGGSRPARIVDER